MEKDSHRHSSSSLKEETKDLHGPYVARESIVISEDGSVDPVYQAKARVISSAIQEIGMGKYQV